MHKILEQIGLTPTEAKVYMALLELGESKSGEILEKADLNSGRIYEVLSSLEKKGMVSTIIKKGIKMFIPSPPERALHYIKERISNLEEKEKIFKKTLPSLQKKFKSLKQKTSVEVFFGGEGQKTAYSILFKEAEKDRNLTVIGGVSLEEYPKEIENNLKYYVYKERRRLKLKIRKLFDEKSRGEKLYAQDKSTIKYISFPTYTCIQTLGNITLILFEKHPIISIVIHNESIAKDFKEQFEFLWKIAKD